MNQEEFNREKKVTKKLLSYFDRTIETLLSNERLTGADPRAYAAVSQNQERILELSKERRALLRQFYSTEKDS